MIGDCETAALVGLDGSIDWLCWPAFDCDACFAALLGDEQNGQWRIAPAGDIKKTSRRYRGNSLILETRFETAEGTVALIDFMPPRGDASDIVRLVRGVSGRVKMRMELVIRFGFGTDIPWVKKNEDGDGLLAICGQDMAVLRTPVKTARRGYDHGGGVRGRRGRNRAVRADLWAVASAGAGRDRSRGSPEGHRGLLARMVQPLHL